MVEDRADAIEDVLIPSYLKTEQEGFLTAAYTYNGKTVAAHVCNPAGGRWRTVGQFTPSNKIAVDGVGVQDSLRAFGTDGKKATNLEDAVLDGLDSIYDRRVRQTSVMDAQFNAARKHASCPEEKRTQTTLTLAQRDDNAAANPVVCKECLRLHEVIISGRRESLNSVMTLDRSDKMVQMDRQHAARRVTSWEETVAAASLWYEARRTADRTVDPTANGRAAWVLMKGDRAVGYVVWENEATPIFRDVYVTDGNRGDGIGTMALRRWMDVIAAGDPFLANTDEDCQSLVKDVAPAAENVIASYELARLELGDETYSSD